MGYRAVPKAYPPEVWTSSVLLNTPPEEPETVFREIGDKKRMVRPFDRKDDSYNVSIARKFSSIWDENEQALDLNKQVKFANLYGILRYKDETLESWEYYVQFFKRVYDVLDSAVKDDLALIKARTLYAGADFLQFQPYIPPTSAESEALNLRPANLLTALGIAMGQELSGNVHLSKCANKSCSNWYEFRPNKKYCNTNCRVSSFNRRKEAASS